MRVIFGSPKIWEVYETFVVYYFNEEIVRVYISMIKLTGGAAVYWGEYLRINVIFNLLWKYIVIVNVNLEELFESEVAFYHD